MSDLRFDGYELTSPAAIRAAISQCRVVGCYRQALEGQRLCAKCTHDIAELERMNARRSQWWKRVRRWSGPALRLGRKCEWAFLLGFLAVALAEIALSYLPWLAEWVRMGTDSVKGAR